eukprot:TRINITY_DN3573_c0_g2_i2.p1 TRINITY_DN3573_c0_g2~~TRINITY_DN3573_c0_g2_i2.p1  ORF type:complete len:130 (+),score=2.17 TRINITY_DN3573_c0_g2_i2:491-880(+)
MTLETSMHLKWRQPPATVSVAHTLTAFIFASFSLKWHPMPAGHVSPVKYVGKPGLLVDGELAHNGTKCLPLARTFTLRNALGLVVWAPFDAHLFFLWQFVETVGRPFLRARRRCRTTITTRRWCSWALP